MPGDGRDVEGCRRRFDHCAERRALLDAELGTRDLEEIPDRLNLIFERHHRNQHADRLFLGEPQERDELDLYQLRILEQQPNAALPKGWIGFC